MPESVPKPSYAVRRRFSGPLLLPPLARRHSTLDTKKLLDLEALYKTAIANIEAHNLDTISDAQSEHRSNGREIKWEKGQQEGRQGGGFSLRWFPFTGLCMI
ncbi:hypothetical protein SRHO_G00167290 [Serrasalmus rhombeus]